tara:strand:- start:358 stop:489 length:132 start_codon:yes stop_codon:yes gene_type:complete
MADVHQEPIENISCHENGFIFVFLLTSEEENPLDAIRSISFGK